MILFFCTGSDDNSKAMTETWENTGEEFNNEQDAVCLKLVADRYYSIIRMPATNTKVNDNFTQIMN